MRFSELWYMRPSFPAFRLPREGLFNTTQPPDAWKSEASASAREISVFLECGSGQQAAVSWACRRLCSCYRLWTWRRRDNHALSRVTQSIKVSRQQLLVPL